MMESFRTRVPSILAFATLVKAQFPLSSNEPEASLKKSNEVTFDPLGIAAILYNPRADWSAARLYTQYDRELFKWPHTMMIGGALTPVKVLTEHLTANISSIHPAVSMCTSITVNLEVQSAMIFPKLPLNLSNSWLSDILQFKSSRNAGNDFMIVCIDDAYQRVAKKEVSKKISRRMRFGRLTLDLIGLVTGIMLIGGMALGILSADIWAVALFFMYASHWVVSTCISRTSLVREHDLRDLIKVDDRVQYAVYQRPEGGTVVFKGRQDTLERWARTTWDFHRTLKNNTLHWLWMITGSLAAISSVACMVNMRGYMQLAFLVVLVYSSFMEILATRLFLNLQGSTKGVGRTLVGNNHYRSQGIIRSTIEIEPKYRLIGLDWIKLGLLPPMPVFQQMQELLAEINSIQVSGMEGAIDAKAEVERKIGKFIDGTAPPLRSLADRIAKETRQAWDKWYEQQDESITKGNIRSSSAEV